MLFSKRNNIHILVFTWLLKCSLTFNSAKHIYALNRYEILHFTPLNVTQMLEAQCFSLLVSYQYHSCRMDKSMTTNRSILQAEILPLKIVQVNLYNFIKWFADVRYSTHTNQKIFNSHWCMIFSGCQIFVRKMPNVAVTKSIWI
jgi:hypothetical protein